MYREDTWHGLLELLKQISILFIPILTRIHTGDVFLGSENVVKYARENLYIVKTLKEFQYIDEEGKDQGSNGELRMWIVTRSDGRVMVKGTDLQDVY